MSRTKTILAIVLFILGGVVMLCIPSTKKKRYFSQDGHIFGTCYHLCYEAPEDLQPIVLEALQQVDECLSIFNDSSTIAQINRGENPATDSLFEVLFKEATLIHEASQGAFDITVSPLVHLWGFGTNTDRTHLPSANEIDSILTFVGMSHIHWQHHRLVKDDPRITLDASAIAKGLGCDMAAKTFAEHGVTNYLVEIGGEVVLQGQNEQGQAWRVGITRPEDHAANRELQDIIQSSSLCMATSGNYRQFYYAQGQRCSHTIDPRTGYPVQHHVLSATVTASSCMRADALATACMVLPEDKGMEMIESIPDAACYLIVAQGDTTAIRTSKRWLQDAENTFVP